MRQKKKSWRNIGERFREMVFRQWVLAALIFFGVFGLLVTDYLPTGVEFVVGEVSQVDVQAPRTMVNRYETSRIQEEVARRVVREAAEDLDNYHRDHSIILDGEERLSGAFNVMRQHLYAEVRDVDEALTDEEVQVILRERWQVELAKDSLNHVLSLGAEEFFAFRAVSEAIISEQFRRKIAPDQEDEVLVQVLEQVQRRDLDPDLNQTVVQLAEAIIVPNLVLDMQRVDRLRSDAVKSVDPVLIVQGEMVIRRGEVVRPEHLQLLHDFGIQRDTIDFAAIIGLAIFTLMLFSFMGVYLYQHRRTVLASRGAFSLLGVVVLGVAFVARLLSWIDWPQIALLTPMALAGILLALLLSSRTAVLATIALSIVIGPMYDFDFSLMVFFIAGGVAAVFSVSRVSQRSDLMRAGFIVGAVNFVLMIALGLLRQDLQWILHSYLGVINGLLSSIVAIGSLPFLETVFNITSAIRLLELSNPNQPLLRRLLLEAPGTYHHSILVGNLAEAAADRLGADGLLVRVGSYYHDIGKLKRPYFFVENQVGDNPHDKIAPSLSNLILQSHVKDGLELAREYKLPDGIARFIGEHHGTDLVRYFYHRAQEQSKEPVEEKDFRYSGPQPRSKETAIVSLADATEAAVRCMNKPTQGRIEGVVRKVIKDRLDYGELDKSELTFRDLDSIADIFSKVLVGMFHGRVKYPEKITWEEVEGKRQQNGNRNH